MIMYESDPDVTQWGLDRIDVYSVSNVVSPESVTSTKMIIAEPS